LKLSNVFLLLRHCMFSTSDASFELKFHVAVDCSYHMDGGVKLLQIFPVNVRPFRAICNLEEIEICSSLKL
jgi:hypothetical protein